MISVDDMYYVHKVDITDALSERWRHSRVTKGATHQNNNNVDSGACADCASVTNCFTLPQCR